MKSLPRIVAFAVMCLCACLTAQDVIVYANAPFAAAELQKFIELSCGKKLPIVEEKYFEGGKDAFYVGQTRFAEEHGVDFSSFLSEEWLYRSKGKDIILGGHSVNGNEYAVWHFLENEFGIRWYTFESTYIPKHRRLSFGKLDRHGRPAFLERQVYSYPWLQGFATECLQNNVIFERRNRINAGWSPVRLSRQTGHCHSFYDYVDPKIYFKDHPEYFSMGSDGKRFYADHRANSQLCLSNPEVAEVATKHLLEYIAKDRSTLPKEQWPTMYDISQLDSTNVMCLCPNCKLIAEAEGSESALVLMFVNKVAGNIAQQFPEITLRTFAYVSTEKAPKTIRPAPNVQIRWCDVFTKSDCYRPLRSEYNKKQYEEIEGWRAKGARLSVWDYWNMIISGPYFTPPRVETMVDAISSDMQYFSSAGVEMIFIEAETRQFDNSQNFYDLQFWLAAQLMDDPRKDAEELIDDFMANHYGPAAGKMKEALKMLRDAVREVKEPLPYILCPARKYQTAEFLFKFYGLLKQAQAQTNEGSDYMMRVNKELITPLAVMLTQFGTGDTQNTVQGVLSEAQRKTFVAEYLKYRIERITKYASKDKQESLTKAAKDDANKYGIVLKIPEKFKDYPTDKIRHLAFPDFGSSVIDETSETGRALVSTPEGKETKHIMKKQIGGYFPTDFGVYDYPSKRGIKMNIRDIPQDEKYHWYNLGKFDIGKRSVVWGFFWRMEVRLSHLYTQADGVADYNTWDFWVSVRITGPAYVANSTSENCIYLDQVVLIKK